jgi:DNA-binding HxlR family transcriptional regulator
METTLTDLSTENCPIGRTLDVIGTTWTLRVLREAFFGVRRFVDFRERLGVSSALLTERFGLLVEHGILVRTAYEEPGQRTRYEYRLTEKGRELYPVMTALREWGERHVLDDDGPPVLVRHRECGVAVGVALVCEHGHTVGVRDVEATPGPGARLRAEQPESRS